MTHCRSVSSWRFNRKVRNILAAVGVLLMTCPAAMAWVDMTEYGVDPYPQPDGIYITDGSYVMNVGELHMNITNFGLMRDCSIIARTGKVVVTGRGAF